MADALLSARCLPRDPPGGRKKVWVSVVTWCPMACLLHVARVIWRVILTFPVPSLCSPVTSNLSAPPAATPSCLPPLTHSQTQSNTASRCSSESLKDKWPWLLTMAVILWRGWGAVSLYSANLITYLLFACVSTQCNLKATPGPLGDAKTACQSTGTPPKWIRVGYSGLSWPWGDVHTGSCSRRNKLNTVFYYRVSVKCVMYVNPSGIGRRRARFWGDKMMVLRGKEEGGWRWRERRSKGNWFKRDGEGDQPREKETLRKWWKGDRPRQKQADRPSQQRKQRARIDRWKDKGTFTARLKSLPILILLIFVTRHV